MRRMTLTWVATALLVMPLVATQAQTHRHAARASETRIGTVRFPTTCHGSAAPHFDRAVTFLHSFEFGSSIKSFEQVLATDSTCAMAHWGIALSRWGNPMAPGNRGISQLRLGSKSADAARRLAANASERERGYITAVGRLYEDFERTDQWARIDAYERAMAALVARQPADTEALIFHALSLSAAARPTDKTYAKQLSAGRLLEQLWTRQPNHPGLAHYIIHSYDHPALAERARAAARRYAEIAPAAAHALHMPSHSFTRLGLWNASARTNSRSMQVALATGSVTEALHAADYAVYADLQAGRLADAKMLLDSLPALAARFETSTVVGAAPRAAGYFALAAIPARWALERGAWSEAAALQSTLTPYPYTEAMTFFARGLGSARIGDLSSAQRAIDSLASIQLRLVGSGESYWAEQVAIQHLTAQAWLDLAMKRDTLALSRMREAAAREDATEKSVLTPGPLAPARELLGDMLVQLGRPQEAKAEYRATLINEPNRRHALRGARRSGSRE